MKGDGIYISVQRTDDMKEALHWCNERGGEEWTLDIYLLGKVHLISLLRHGALIHFL